MDATKTFMEFEHQNHSLENLSKNELVKICRDLLEVADKAKIAQDALQQEVELLKCRPDPSTAEMLESISNESTANVCCSALNIENQDLKLRIVRMSDENRQLLSHLDYLEKQIVYLNKIGLEQRQQLLLLEQSNLNYTKHSSDKKCEEVPTIVGSLEVFKCFKHENRYPNAKMSQLPDFDSDDIILPLKKKIDRNYEEFKSVATLSHDNTIELHVNKGDHETSTNLKRYDFQIVSSNITSEIENEKLKERNKLFRAKIVRFAAEIRKLKTDKEYILLAFKHYNSNVKTWKEKLEKLLHFLSIAANRSDCTIKDLGLLKEEHDIQNKTIGLLNIELGKRNEENLLFEDIIKMKRLLKTLAVSQVENIFETGEQSLNLESNKNNVPLTLKLVEHTKMTSKEDSSQMQEILDVSSIQPDLQTHNIDDNVTFNIDSKPSNSSEQIREPIIQDGEPRPTNSCAEDISNISNCVKLDEESIDLNYTSNNSIDTSRRINPELLSEINFGNQTLKEHEESISQYQSKYEHLLKIQQRNEMDIKELLFSISEKDKIIFSLRRQSSNNSAENEINNEFVHGKSNDIIASHQEAIDVKEMLNVDVNKDYKEIDTMSTSTISKAEELGRFKDLDASWEDRYSRLRSLALKQKAKIRDLTAQLGDPESNINNINLKLTNNSRIVQTLQSQCDTLQDDLDVAKAETKQYRKKVDDITQDISRDKVTLVANDDIINSMKNKLERLENDKTNTEIWKKQVNLKVQSLKKELAANVILKRDFELKLADLNTKLDEKDRLLREETYQHAETKNSLKDFSNECKKQSMLNLELQNNERIVTDLNQRLEKRADEYNKLQEHMNVLNQTSCTQCEKIQLLEAQIVKSDREMVAKNQDLEDWQTKCFSLESALSEKEMSTVSCMISFEEVKRQNEYMNMQLSKVQNLQQHLTEVEELIRLRDIELSNLKSEYDGYKVRAQSVLRQNHPRDIGIEEKLSEEADSLRSCMNIMQRECEELRNSLSEFKTSNDQLMTQKRILDNRIIELERKMEIQNEKCNNLSDQYHTAISEHSESMKILKAQSDTLANCYRTKLHELETRHTQEILQLQAHVDKSSLFVSTGITELLPTSSVAIIPPPMAREAAEGSDSVDNMNKIYGTMMGFGTGGNHHSLEQLLEGGDSCVHITNLKRQLMDHESRVTHLTELLADTEQDLAKHVQMNLVLKEEIRRQQRSIEREKNAENFEYMKNIIVKFITLGNGDERQRLVPVLNTILKLSPIETQKINAIAKGDNRAWSNYLPAWSKQQ